MILSVSPTADILKVVKLVGGRSDINGATPSSFIEYTDISRFYNHCRKFYLKVQCIKIDSIQRKYYNINKLVKSILSQNLLLVLFI